MNRDGALRLDGEPSNLAAFLLQSDDSHVADGDAFADSNVQFEQIRPLGELSRSQVLGPLGV